jgi:chromate transporter
MSPSLAELTHVFARIGCLSFGGPAAQIALMHHEVVEKRAWVAEKEYLSALSFCMLLPGPEAMQLATWIGWRSHGVRGGLIAGLLFVIPGALVVLALSAIYAVWGQVPVVSALFLGVQAAVLAVVVEALIRIGRRGLKSGWQRGIAVAAFVALFAFALPFPVVIVGAAALGTILATQSAKPTPSAAPTTISLKESLSSGLIWSAVWLVPLAALWWFEGGLLWEIGAYFSQLALLTFGGAYAVLAWMVQDVVQVQGWLTTGQMMTGLGLAETTPGPLILVTEFVGFMAGWQVGGWDMALAGAGVALWMTFAPCFLWIFFGAPHLARLTAIPRLSAALAGVTAAVVGVIASLSLWFALHVLFSRTRDVSFGPMHLDLPDLSSLQPWPFVIAVAASYALIGRHWSLPLVLALSALAGAARTLI